MTQNIFANALMRIRKTMNKRKQRTDELHKQVDERVLNAVATEQIWDYNFKQMLKRGIVRQEKLKFRLIDGTETDRQTS